MTAINLPNDFKKVLSDFFTLDQNDKTLNRLELIKHNNIPLNCTDLVCPMCKSEGWGLPHLTECIWCETLMKQSIEEEKIHKKMVRKAIAASRIKK